jgi:hypothetical protein
MGLQYKIQYKVGSTNDAADALSRCELLMIGAVSMCTPSWQDKEATGYHDNAEEKAVGQPANRVLLGRTHSLQK